MIKYRVWDIDNKKFIYPVLDITNNFQSNYPPNKFIFDRCVYVDSDGIEYYQNDIVNRTYWESFTSENNILLLSVIINESSVQRLDRYIIWAYSLPKLIKYKNQRGSWKEEASKVGNVHQNLNLLLEQYEQLKC